ncbi:MAG: QueT transporter family protein [Clostridiales Family XIII bacterium]|nr:QueT transporter family protein [Clostridiales Family XIII bacterium]
MNLRKNVRFWVQAAVIGGVYAALTMALAPISYGPMQVRVSEALTVLPYFTPAAVPGLFVGCFVANTISFYGVPDMIFGSLATLAGAFLSYKLRKRAWLVPLPPILVNGVVIGAMLYFIYGVEPSLLADMAWVALGECLACYALGYPLLRYLKRHERIFRLTED